MSPADEIRALPYFARTRVFSILTAEVEAMLEARPPAAIATGAYALWLRLAEPTGDPAFEHKRELLRDLLGIAR